MARRAERTPARCRRSPCYAQRLARAKGTAKRGSAALHLKLDESPEVASGSADREIAGNDEALQALGQFDARKVVGLRFFGGLSVEEAPDVLKISLQSIMRDRKLARAWLLTELQR